jgi:hypothetical protein
MKSRLVVEKWARRDTALVQGHMDASQRGKYRRNEMLSPAESGAQIPARTESTELDIASATLVVALDRDQALVKARRVSLSISTEVIERQRNSDAQLEPG